LLDRQHHIIELRVPNNIVDRAARTNNFVDFFYVPHHISKILLNIARKQRTCSSNTLKDILKVSIRDGNVHIRKPLIQITRSHAPSATDSIPIKFARLTAISKI